MIGLSIYDKARDEDIENATAEFDVEPLVA
jgi:hypothetical protein